MIDMAAVDPFADTLAKSNYYNRNTKYTHIHLKIDLTRNEKELVSAFKANIARWIKKDSEKQSKKTEYDPWTVFDMYIATDNYTVIARKLSGNKANQTDNPALRLALKRTKNAFNRAIKMIVEVELDAEPVSTHY
jgi:hypothetical protein